MQCEWNCRSQDTQTLLKIQQRLQPDRQLLATGGRYAKPNNASMNRTSETCSGACVYIYTSTRLLCICECGCVFIRVCLWMFICDSVLVLVCVCVCFSPGNLCSVSQLSNNLPQSAALTSKHTLAHWVCSFCVSSCLLLLCVFVSGVTVSCSPFVGVLHHDRPSYLSHHAAVCLSVSVCLSLSAEFSAKSEDKDGNSLAFQFLSGAKVTVLASKTSRESNSTKWWTGFS